MFTGDSAIAGALTTFPGTGVRFISCHLLYFRPERQPHQSVARASSSVVRFITNSPVRLMMSYECLSGLTDTEHIGGSLLMVPVQAIVMMLYSSGSWPQLTITAGMG